MNENVATIQKLENKDNLKEECKWIKRVHAIDVERENLECRTVDQLTA